MLLLSRKKNESIVIDGDITIVVVDIRGDKVRLGIEAPKEVSVHRREVFDAITRRDTGLASKVVQSPEGGQVDLGKQLKEYLSTGRYINASKIVSENKGLATDYQLIELGSGLVKELGYEGK